MLARPFYLAFLAMMGTLLACTPPPKGDNAIPFEELTIQKIAANMPDGRDYITVVGQGYPGDGEKEQEARRKTAREGAVVAAQEKMIVELKKLAPREKVRELLSQARVAKVDYAYDDICTATLRLLKELVTGQEQER